MFTNRFLKFNQGSGNMFRILFSTFVLPTAKTNAMTAHVNTEEVYFIAKCMFFGLIEKTLTIFEVPFYKAREMKKEMSFESYIYCDN